MDTEFESAIEALVNGGVEFVIVGGLAATVHGSARLTHDLDIVYRRTPENLGRLASALAPHSPYLRGAPPGLPFVLDADTLRRGLNFTLTTGLGPIDLLGEMAGAGTYDDVVGDCVEVVLFGRRCQVASVSARSSKRSALLGARRTWRPSRSMKR